jgi:hypothetical protein
MTIEQRAEDYAYSQFIKMIPTKDGYGYLNLEWEHARVAFLAGSKEGRRDAVEFALKWAESGYIDEREDAVKECLDDYLKSVGDWVKRDKCVAMRLQIRDQDRLISSLLEMGRIEEAHIADFYRHRMYEELDRFNREVK